MQWLMLGPASSLADGACREFQGPDGQPCFLVRRGNEIFGYRNHCPHRGIELNWMPDDFLTADGQWLRCSTHGALFGIGDGVCVSGPCAGRRLQAVPMSIRDDQIAVQLEDPL